MNWDNISSKFDFLFRIHAFLFRSHYERKFFPKQQNSVKDLCDHWVHYIGAWGIVIFIYLTIVYVFFVDPGAGTWDRLADFYQRSPELVLKEIYTKIRPSIFLNIVVLWLTYKALSAFAERTVLWDHFVHHKSNGLIKVIKVGTFGADGTLREVDQKLLDLSRKQIFTLVQPEEKELISIVSASGWDLFGDGPAMPSAPLKVNLEKKSFRWLKKKTDKSFENVENGYLLTLLKNRTKRFEIILLDPKSPSAQMRAEAYLELDAHKVLASHSEYSDNIKKVCKKLFELKKLNPNIEIRLTSEMPQWRMIMTEGEVWFQPILSRIRSDHTPMYGFKKGPQSLYHSLFAYNEHLWHRGRPLTETDLA